MSKHHVFLFGAQAPHTLVAAYADAAPGKRTSVRAAPRDSDKESTTGVITDALNRAKSTTATHKVLYLVGSFWGEPGIAAVRAWAIENGYTLDETCAVNRPAMAVAQALLDQVAGDRKKYIVMKRYFNKHRAILDLLDDHGQNKNLPRTSEFLAGLKNLGGVTDVRTDSEKMVDYFEGVTEGCDYESIVTIGRTVVDAFQRMALDHILNTAVFYELADGRRVAIFSHIPGVARHLHDMLAEKYRGVMYDLSAGIHPNPKEDRYDVTMSSAHNGTNNALVLAKENNGGGNDTSAGCTKPLDITQAIDFLKGAKRISP
ncbi:hypothetical protein pqer_cds_709 [Pandoravirus quercus]|uniref:Uncharacterized protein n=2 Tax=Pandoravirus TaxID=2060084 RepID=A0A2U7U9L2_9VIRU|nr:hypothetical protein pqer_cds_709 [Pandoravirus quercus]AVK75131.1 hypothetical protein pqer_cds_709 [Pandoravirus quercus]QBZ81295.1 hypothetical protein pclt_cds_708 [Pandoravirus celtis]